MKRRILSLLLTLTAVCSLGLVGCSNSKGDSNVAEGHVHTYTESIVKPTCIDKGYTLHSCYCGDFYREDFVDALGHDFSDYTITKYASCGKAGEKTATCSRCFYVDKIEIPAITPAFEQTQYVWSNDFATCTATRVCSNCDSHTETETVVPIYKVESNATTLAEGRGVWTAVFNNPAFEKQERSVILPMLNQPATIISAFGGNNECK